MKKFLTFALVFAWLGFGAVAVLTMARYINTPGIAAVHAPRTMPDRPELVGRGDSPTLLLFAHPHCPCTRAAVAELEKIAELSGGKLNVYAFFFQPREEPDDFHRTALWEKAGSIKGVSVIADYDGEAAARFDARTSGQVLLYDAAGKLVFRGGITAGRGHEGENEGSAAIIEFLERGDTVNPDYAVFGCAIADDYKTFENNTAQAR